MAGVYIGVSGILARAASGGDVALLERIELWKGIGFVAITALVAFGATRFFLMRIARHRQALATSHRALLEVRHRATAGMLAAAIAHDLNNILQILEVGVDEAAELEPGGVLDGELVDDMRTALTQARRLSKRLSKAAENVGPGDAETVELGPLVRDTVELCRRHHSARGSSVAVDVAEGLTLRVHTSLVQQAVSNLVINAAEAVGGGSIRVTLAPIEDGARLEVHDDGPGVPEELREKLFRPFYTSKRTGTGLGLMSVRLCAATHGGDISIATSPDLRGARFTLDLRAATEQPPAELIGGWDAMDAAATV